MGLMELVDKLFDKVYGRTALEELGGIRSLDESNREKDLPNKCKNQNIKAEERIPQEAYSLIDGINKRYSQLNLDSGDFKDLNESGKLSKLIDIINNDSEISQLNSLNSIGSIYDKNNLPRGVHDYRLAPAFSGVNLCIGRGGLHIYKWDDYSNTPNDEIFATPNNLEKYFGKIDARIILNAVIDYTNRDNYIKRVVDFKMFNYSGRMN